MRIKKYYVLKCTDEECGYSELQEPVYSSNEYIVRLFIQQYNKYTFDIYECDCSDVFELVKIMYREHKILIEPNTNELHVIHSVNKPNVSIVTTDAIKNWVMDGEGEIMLTQEMISSLLNISVYAKYIINDADKLNEFTSVLANYAKRYLTAFYCDIYNIPNSALEKIGLSQSDSIYDLYDEALMIGGVMGLL